MTFRGTSLFIGIDGTGTSDDREYARNFQNSHVHRLSDQWRGGRSHYARGPTIEGFATMRLATWAARTAEETATALQRNTTAPLSDMLRVYIAGYSRGGAAAIKAADLLRGRLDVHCLLLFDAVDRSVLTQGVDTIPTNVAFCFHAMRDPAALSRVSFSNCGTEADRRRTHFETRQFMATHGAMGGVPASSTYNGLATETPSPVPLTRVPADQLERASAVVWSWMQNGLNTARSA